MKKILVIALILLCCESAFCADIVKTELEAMVIKSEFNRLGNSSDPFEKESLLLRIIDKCKDTEEGEAAYWDLADLYLNDFPEEMRQEACEMLELSLRNYPNTRRSILVKCRLIDLYEKNNSRRAELIKELKNNNHLPTMLKNALN